MIRAGIKRLLLPVVALIAACVLLTAHGEAKATCYHFTGTLYVEAWPQVVEIEVEGCTEDFQNFPATAR